MKVSLAFAVTAALGLAGCTTYEGLPSAVEPASSTVPPDARADFNLLEQVEVATRACLSSETDGPAALQQLLSQGYTLISDIDGTFYARMEPLTGKGLLDNVKLIRVSDPNNRLACTIQVPRGSGREALAAAVAAAGREGLRPVATRGDMLRLAGEGRRFGITGSYRLSSPYAEIEIARLTVESDRLCRDSSLPPESKEGC